MKQAALSAIVIFALLGSLVAGLQIVKAVETNPKTITVPGNYPTIQAAIDNAPEGTTVLVKSGTYLNLNLTIDKSISLIGENKATILKGQRLSTQPQVNPLTTQHPAQTLTHLSAQNDANVQAAFTNFVPPYPQASKVIIVNAPNVNISGFTINNADVCIEVNSYNVQIVDNILSANDHAVDLRGHSNRVENNTITGHKAVFSVGISNAITGNLISCYIGVELYSNSNIVSENIFQTRAIGTAIIVSKAWDHTGGSHIISKNNLTGNGNGWGISLGVTAPNNSVFENNITSYDEAVLLTSSSYNSFYANCISNCNTAIVLAGSASLDPELPYSPKNNTFYHNNFVNNTLSVETRDDKFLETSNSTKNYWDNGKEGNFWSNYNGTDANGDGIGDTPHIIDVKRQDNFPLILPFDVENNTIEYLTILPTPSPSPTPTISSSPTQKSSPTLTSLPTQEPTLSPSSTANPSVIFVDLIDYGTISLPYLLGVVAAVAAVVVGLLVYFKKKR